MQCYVMSEQQKHLWKLGGSNVVTFGPNVFGGLLGEGVGAVSDKETLILKRCLIKQ